MTARVPMTKTGAELMHKTLDHLKTVERRRITKAIEEARKHGDLKENAEYHAAKEEQAIIEAKIRDLEHKLSHANVIDVTQLPDTGKVVFGVTVELMHQEAGATISYQIVGEDEADVNSGKISITSPIARALIGKAIGDVVEVRTPRGMVEYEIVDVKYI